MSLEGGGRGGTVGNSGGPRAPRPMFALTVYGRGGIVGDSGGPPRGHGHRGPAGMCGGIGHAGRRTDTREEDGNGGQAAGNGGDSGEVGFVCPEVTFI